ncbi:metal-dependent hydrolase family protein [Arenibaculum pallidiluteum]|uniref:metal-dependent hydrolase family protein n=1 Tax=Arenibaculum pallidiluteum TaxID=2812559 RepID=UPI001A966780|nr:amidohydrolase family protein [Arenibaculum pallidiluteum]
MRLTSFLPCLTCAGLMLSSAAHAQDRPAAQAPDRWKIIHAGTLLALPGSPARQNASIIVRNDRIHEVRDGFVEAGAMSGTTGSAVTVVDLSKHFVLPGLIDSHVHITDERSPTTQLDRVTKTGEAMALEGTLYARRTLEAGFTTVRDLGSRGNPSLALRDAIRKGQVPGPRIVAAGQSISATGGHSDVNGYAPDIFPELGENICNGADQCRHAARLQVKRGADVIKITATGGVLSNVAAGTGLQMFEDELKAIVDASHALGRRVAAHAHGADGVNAALRAGVDSIEHGTYLDDESIALFKKSGAWLVPTVLAGETVTVMAEQEGFFPPAVRDKARAVGPQMINMLRRAYQGGVKIAFGTDTGVSRHGQNAKEFALMTRAGIPAEVAIRMATVDAADLLGLSGQIGTIEPGKAADVVAVTGNPTEDITELERVAFVMKDGNVHKGPEPLVSAGAATPTP